MDAERDQFWRGARSCQEAERLYYELNESNPQKQRNNMTNPNKTQASKKKSCKKTASNTQESAQNINNPTTDLSQSNSSQTSVGSGNGKTEKKSCKKQSVSVNASNTAPTTNATPETASLPNQSQCPVSTANTSGKTEKKKHSKSNKNKADPGSSLSEDSLTGEVQRARQQLRESLRNCEDGQNGVYTGLNARLEAVEKKNAELVKSLSALTDLVKSLEQTVKKTSASSSATCAVQSAAKRAPPPKKSPPTAADNNDDEIDLFASDSDGEDQAAAKVRADRLAAYNAKKSKKPQLIAKSNIIFDVKPWEDTTDMKELEAVVRSVEHDGLLWGAAKLVPLAYGIQKLQISSVLEDEKVSVDWLQETIENKGSKFIQSVDIAAFNKV